MPVEKDNHIDPELKARWGFAGTEDGITVGPQTVGETGGVDHARTRVEEAGGRNSGGGADESEGLRTQVLQLKEQLSQTQADLAAARNTDSTEDSRDSLTIPQIKEQLDAKSIQYKTSDSKPELLALLKAAQ